MEQAERITFTAPAELAAKINEAAEADGCSRSEFLRKAIANGTSVTVSGQKSTAMVNSKAKKMGIKPEDIDDIIHEYREEVAREEESGS